MLNENALLHPPVFSYYEYVINKYLENIPVGAGDTENRIFKGINLFVMAIRISEKKLLFAVLLIAAGIYALYAVKLIALPVYVSERGVLITAAAIGALFLGIKLLKGSVRQA